MSLVGHVLAAGGRLNPRRVVIVAGHGAEAVTKAVAKLDPEAQVVLQIDQLAGHIDAVFCRQIQQRPLARGQKGVESGFLLPIAVLRRDGLLIAIPVCAAFGGLIEII